MKFSLIICTYKRAFSVKTLLDSVENQTLYPNSIIIVDGSTDNNTKTILQKYDYKNLTYQKVNEEDRGLTKQRNIGVQISDKNTDILCFLDDDITLDEKYFENLISTYNQYPKAVAVGGYISNEVKWIKKEYTKNRSSYFCFDNYCRKESLRHKVRRIIGLAPDRPPCFLPEFSHGYSVGHIPPSGNIYEVEQFMGGVSSYRFSIFSKIKFSQYFEGYGLYEDADFCFRLLKHGKLYVNTSAICEHHHEPSGRPNRFKYGKMVAINGWYVWRLRWPNPGFKNKLKWHMTTLLLCFLRFLNTFTTSNRIQAFSESIGRLLGWIILLIKKPKIIK